MKGDSLVLIDIEGVEQLLNILFFGDDDLPGESVPYYRYLLKEFHEVPKIHVSFVFCEDEPAEPGLFKLAAFEDDVEVFEVVVLGDVAVAIVVDEVEYSANEGVFPAE